MKGKKVLAILLLAMMVLSMVPMGLLAEALEAVPGLLEGFEFQLPTFEFPGIGLPVVEPPDGGFIAFAPMANDKPKTVTMKSLGSGNVLQFIFVFNLIDGETGKKVTTTLDPRTGEATGNNPGGQISGGGLEKDAIYDDGSGFWKIGDQVVNIDIYDLNMNYIETVMFAAITHRSGDGVIREDGTSNISEEGIIQSNGGTANYWFTGVNLPIATRVIVEKKWIDGSGKEIESMKNKYVDIELIDHLGTESHFGDGFGKTLPANIVVPTRTKTLPLTHIFSETIVRDNIPAGYDKSSAVLDHVEWPYDHSTVGNYSEVNGVVTICTCKLPEGGTYYLTFVNRVSRIVFSGELSLNKAKLNALGAWEAWAVENEFFFSIYESNATGAKIGSALLTETIDGASTSGKITFVLTEAAGFVPGYYLIVEDPSSDPNFGWKIEDKYSGGILIELVAEGSNLIPYLVGPPRTRISDNGLDVGNLPILGSLRVNVDIKQQNKVQDWRYYTEQDWRYYTEQDWRYYTEQDWRYYTEQDWRYYTEQDWRYYTEQDWRYYTEQDWRYYSEQDWRYYKEQDWRYYTEQDWRYAYEQDWRNIIAPEYAPEGEIQQGPYTGAWFGGFKQAKAGEAVGTSKAGGGLVPTAYKVKQVTGGYTGNGNNTHTYIKLDTSDILGAANKQWIILGTSNPNNPRREDNQYGFFVHVEGNSLVISFDYRFIDANMIARVLDKAPTAHDTSKELNFKPGDTYVLPLPSVTNTWPALSAKVSGNGNTRMLDLAVGAAKASYPLVNNSNTTYKVGDYTVQVNIKGNDVYSAAVISGPSNGATIPATIYLHFFVESIRYMGQYQFVRWYIWDTEDVGDLRYKGPENVGAARKFTENIGDVRTLSENVGKVRILPENVGLPRTFSENVGPARQLTENVGVERQLAENVGLARQLTENVGAARQLAENVGAARQLTENVGAARQLAENVGAARQLTENVGAARQLTENVGAARQLTENVGAARQLAENVGATRQLTENVGAERRFAENVGAERNDGAPVAYTGALTLSFSEGPTTIADITVTNGSLVNRIISDLLPGTYRLTLSGTGFTTMTTTATVTAGNEASASFATTLQGTLRQNQLADDPNARMIELPADPDVRMKKVGDDTIVRMIELLADPNVRMIELPADTVIRMKKVGDDTIVRMIELLADPNVRMKKVGDDTIVRMIELPADTVIRMKKVTDDSVVRKVRVADDPVVRMKKVADDPVVRKIKVADDPVIRMIKIADDPVVRKVRLADDPVVRMIQLASITRRIKLADRKACSECSDKKAGVINTAWELGANPYAAPYNICEHTIIRGYPW